MLDNPSNGRRVVSFIQTDGRTERHNEVYCHFSQFCERAYKHEGFSLVLTGKNTEKFILPMRIAPGSCAIELSIYGRAYYASVNGTFHI
jgi:hypothetical protein